MILSINQAFDYAQREYAVRTLLADRPMTVIALVAATGISGTTCWRMIEDLHDAGVVYIHDWEIRGKSKTAIWAMGDRPDAVYQTQTKDDRARAFAAWSKRVGPRPRVADAERQARKDVQRAHDQQMAAWVPRADIAAAWMRNPTAGSL